MTDFEITNKPLSTSILGDDSDSSEQTDARTLSVEMREQYLEQLYRQYNIKATHAILFYLPNQTEPMIFVDKKTINIGRSDAKGRIIPEFDLGTFDGAELGVSRLHARIVWDEDRYLLQDLASTNYTRIDKQKITAYQWYPIEDGRQIQFGRLVTTVFVIQSEDD
ncbi:MAG: hypothetical protein Phog2KO_24690 [Phototrophicaceae bacterium]